MAADSCASDGYNDTVRRDPKLFRLDTQFVVGATTSYRFIQIMRFLFNPPERKIGQSVEQYLVADWATALRTALTSNGYTRKEKEGEDSGGTALIAYAGRLFTLHDDFQIAEARESYAAVGSGAQLALGSLWTTEHMAIEPEARLQMAIKAAIDHARGVKPPVLIEKLEVPS